MKMFVKEKVKIMALVNKPFICHVLKYSSREVCVSVLIWK
jgi:hypothetical protein